MTDPEGNWPKLSTIFAAVATAAITVAAVAAAVVVVATAAPALVAVGGTIVSTAAIATAATIVGVQAATVAVVSAAAAVSSYKTESQSYSVYTLKDQSGKTQYVGRVTDKGYNARMAHHEKTRGLVPALRVSGLSYIEARGLEELAMIECHTLNPSNPINNQIHGISPTNVKGEVYMKAACDYLFNRAEDWVLNIFE